VKSIRLVICVVIGEEVLGREKREGLCINLKEKDGRVCVLSCHGRSMIEFCSRFLVRR
jgi:hypothetical protein